MFMNHWLKVLLASACLLSCISEEQFPDEPTLKWERHEWILQEIPDVGTVERLRVELSFTDGDGNVGLEEDQVSPPFDTTSAFYYNLWVRYYEKQGDSMVEIITPVPFSTRIPNLTPQGQNRTLEGLIQYDMDLSQATSDSVQFKFILLDRDLNQSPEVTSPLLPSSP
jgi:hypothetical protein